MENKTLITMTAENADNSTDGSMYLVTQAMAALIHQIDENKKILSIELKANVCDIDVGEYPIRVDRASIYKNNLEVYMDSDLISLLRTIANSSRIDSDMAGEIIQKYYRVWRERFIMYNEHRMPKSMWDRWQTNSKMLLNMASNGDIDLDQFIAYLNTPTGNLNEQVVTEEKDPIDYEMVKKILHLIRGNDYKQELENIEAEYIFMHEFNKRKHGPNRLDEAGWVYFLKTAYEATKELVEKKIDVIRYRDKLTKEI